LLKSVNQTTQVANLGRNLMLNSVNVAAMLCLSMVMPTGSAAFASDRQADALSTAPSTTLTKTPMTTSARNWREWFLCEGQGACGGANNEPVSREPVNIPRNPNVQADESKPVNSLMFTIEGMPGTLPGLKIGTP
jgi:hypothetical protein